MKGKIVSLKDEARQGSDDFNITLASPKLFEPHRILIMKLLQHQGESYFKELRDLLRMTDGNLVSHLRALELAKYIEVRKEIEGRKVKTIYTLTRAGDDAFTDFTKLMKAVVTENGNT